jgi:hypothetical protein
MKKLYSISFIITGLFILCMTQSCYYDNLEELNPKDTTQVTGCDTSGVVNFSTHMTAIFTNYCTNCHSGNTPSGALNLTNYNDAKAVAASGKLLGAVTWDGTASPMPKGASQKIPACNIEQIKKWIRTNYAQ